MFLWKSPLISKRVSSPVFLIRFLALFTLILAVTLYSGTLTSSAITQNAYSQELIAQSPAPTSDQPSPSTPSNIPTADTALLFQNDRYAVRVFGEGNKAYVNIYDKENKTLTLKKIPVSITLAKNPKKDPIKYVAVIGNQQYTVIISPLGASELTIAKGGTVVYRQSSNQVEVAQKVPGLSDQTVAVNPIVAVVRTIFINYAKLTIFAFMFSIAIRWRFEDVIWLWKQPSLLLRSLVSVFMAVPLLGALTMLIPGLTVAQHIGIWAMITCPGAPMIPFKSLQAGGNKKFVASLQFMVCILAVISIPLTVLILSQFSPNEAWLSPQEIAQQIFFVQVLPMGIGVLLAQYSPKLADDLLEPVTQIAKFMLLLVVILLLAISLDKIFSAGLMAYLAIGFLSIASLACGHVLGGPKPETQTVLAYATATRNAGLAVLLVSLNFPNLDFIKGGIMDSLITYALITAFVSIPYTIWRKRTMVAN